MLGDLVDGEGNAGDGEHGGNNVVGRGGRSPWVRGGEVEGHLVDGNALDQTDVDLFVPKENECE